MHIRPAFYVSPNTQKELTMKKLITAIATTAAAVAVIAAPGAASAVEVDQYDRVSFVFCSDNRYGNEINYYDSNGNLREQVNVRFDQHRGGNRWCDSTGWTEYDEYGSYVWSAISNDNSPYVFCAIYTGRYQAAASEDYDTSGYGYVATMC
ncbi:hypothetical protein PBI_GRAY_91 [Gordonia phage Gray]|nr:hypothetical protein PBI_GRAY_91 [Gordonia phage Gray]